MVVSADGEGEATWNLRHLRVGERTTQSAACEHSLLLLVKADGTEFLPVADELVFHYNLVNG